MNVSELLFDTNFKTVPQEPDLVKSCLLKQRTLEKTCTDPALKRWNLTDMLNQKHLPDADSVCCFAFDVITCQRRVIPTVNQD